MPVTLTSSAFGDGDVMPHRFTCDGENLPPPLTWSGAPDGTRSFALTMEDLDARPGTFMHWVLYDIPSHAAEWPGNWGGKTMLNGFGRSGYGGPCPPPGDGPHRYVFTVYAVSIRYLAITGDPVAALRSALASHAIANGQLVGRYQR